MIRTIILTGVSAIAFTALANAAPLQSTTALNDVNEIGLTKSQCQRKKGYIWIPSTGKCIKDTRGSY